MNCANHPDRERVAFCQHCGKPLCEECKRVDGASVYCEQCFAVRGAAAPPAGFTTPSGYSSGPYAAAPGYGPGMPPPRRSPEPAVAAMLGFIPGVGAMYNEQYAKGIVHLIVFAVLVSLASNAGNDLGPIFGLFIAGWVFYMVFEAYHTARARRDGTPLPNPFGLNDLGERLGFGRSWPDVHPPYPGSSVPPYDPAATQAGPRPVPPAAGFVPNQPGGQPWSGPGPTYFHQGADGSQTYGAPPASQWGAPYDVPPVPPVPPFPEGIPPHHRSLPTGAIWLIGIGVLFLIGHAPVFRVFHGRLFVPMVLIAIGVWMFVRRMTETGLGLENDGSDTYRWRLAYALNGAAWVVLVGVISLLDALHVLSWSQSWPIFIIAAGVLMIFRRTLFSPGYAAVPPYAVPPAPTPPSATAAPVTSMEIVPVDPDLTRHDHHDSDQEGR